VATHKCNHVTQYILPQGKNKTQNKSIFLMRSAEFLLGTNDHKTEIPFTRLLYWHVKYQLLDQLLI